MEKLYAVKEKLCNELKEYGAKEKLDLASLEVIDKLAHAIKNIDKIIEAYEEEEMGMSSRAGGGSSYYRGGSYARGRGRSARRNSLGQYSSAGSYGYRYPRSYDGYARAEDEVENMISYLQDAMQDLPPEKQREFQRFMEQM